MEPHKFVMGILLFAFFISGGLYVMYGGIDDDNVGLFDEYNIEKTPVMSKLENITKDKAEEGYNISQVQQGEVIQEMDTTSGWRVADIGPIKVVRRMVQYFKLVGVMTQGIADILKIPAFVVNFVMTLVVITVLFMIVYLTIKFQPRP